MGSFRGIIVEMRISTFSRRLSPTVMAAPAASLTHPAEQMIQEEEERNERLAATAKVRSVDLSSIGVV
jgi:hypothetical protein